MQPRALIPTIFVALSFYFLSSMRTLSSQFFISLEAVCVLGTLQTVLHMIFSHASYCRSNVERSVAAMLILLWRKKNICEWNCRVNFFFQNAVVPAADIWRPEIAFSCAMWFPTDSSCFLLDLYKSSTYYLGILHYRPNHVKWNNYWKEWISWISSVRLGIFT